MYTKDLYMNLEVDFSEYVEMKKVLEKLGLEIFDMTKSTPETARLDGGDVIFTGSEFFVGHSSLGVG